MPVFQQAAEASRHCAFVCRCKCYLRGAANDPYSASRATVLDLDWERVNRAEKREDALLVAIVRHVGLAYLYDLAGEEWDQPGSSAGSRTPSPRWAMT